MSYTWSHYSLALQDAFLSPQDNIIVQACPGSGKTTNIKELCRLAPLSDETCCIAFNKAIADHLKTVLPAHINASTINGLGHRSILSAYGQVTLDDRKVYKIIRDLYPHYVSRASQAFGGDDRNSALYKAVAMLKMHSIIPPINEFNAMLSTYDIEEYPDIYHNATEVLWRSDNMPLLIDFNDQLRFPVVKGLPVPSYDNIFVDEAQDLNPIQAALIEKMNGRYIFVGDRHQSIYGFRGAMTDSMDVLKATFGCVELPLSLTYRCPRLVVQEAAILYPDIEALDSAPDGIVRLSKGIEQYTPDALILCRNNGPLIEYAYDLLRRDIACHVRGRDISAGLVSLVKKLGSQSVRDLIEDIESWREVEVTKATRRDDDAKIQRVNDKADSVLVFTTRCKLHDGIDCVVSAINTLFEQGKGVCLSTVHKAKGLEATDVYLLRYDLMPARYAVQPWARIQERNIEYVAVTRSKSQLVYM